MATTVAATPLAAPSWGFLRWVANGGHLCQASAILTVATTVAIAMTPTFRGGLWSDATARFVFRWRATRGTAEARPIPCRWSSWIPAQAQGKRSA